MATPRILVVDDEIIIARELEARLKQVGYTVAAIAASGDEAIRLAQELYPDLVLMDIVLKGDLDGIEAAMEIRRTCRIPVVYVTAYTDDQTLERAKVTEPFGYIVKPFSERELRANIEMALYKHRMETRLRRMEQWLAKFCEGQPCAVVAADTNGRIQMFSEGAEAITAWPASIAVGQAFENIVRLVERQNGTPVALDELADGPLVRLAADTLLLDWRDEAIPIDTTVSHVRDESEQHIGTVAIMRDAGGLRHGALSSLVRDVSQAVAESLTLREMLQDSVEALVAHLDAAFARVWTVNAAGDTLVLQASAGMYTRIDGTYARVPVGQFKIGRIAETQEPYLSNDVARDPLVRDPEWAEREGLVAFAGHPLIVEGRLLGVVALFSKSPLPAAAAEALATVSRTMALGLERKRLEEQLQFSQKLEAVGQLAGGVAHDFNNLLTVISGCAESLLHDFPLNPEATNLAGDIAEAGRRAAELTRKLLAFSRRQPLAPKVVSLNGLVTGMEGMLNRMVGERVPIAVQACAAPDHIFADANALEQVIVNLIVNARDAMPEGGPITIATRNAELDEAFAYIHPEVPAGDYVLLSVSDRGHGMTREVMAHIFEPFFTTKGPGKGTGLGLAMVYGIVKQNKGHISVYSEPGIGTEIKVYLPSVDSPSLVKVETTTPEQAKPGTETILLVEDDPVVLALTQRILTGYGYQVVAVCSGDEALAHVEAHPGHIDLLISDVVMPGMTGGELAREVSQRLPGIKTLFVSGYAEPTFVDPGLGDLSGAFVQKPFLPRTLAAKVRAVLDQQW